MFFRHGREVFFPSFGACFAVDNTDNRTPERRMYLGKIQMQEHANSRYALAIHGKSGRVVKKNDRLGLFYDNHDRDLRLDTCSRTFRPVESGTHHIRTGDHVSIAVIKKGNKSREAQASLFLRK